MNGTESLLRAAVSRLEAGTDPMTRPVAAFVLPDARVGCASDATHAGSLGLATQAVLAAFDGHWSAGDIAVSNDPFHGGVHVCSFTLVRPLDVGAIALRMRFPDVGGFDFGGLAPRSFDTWGEGARYVPLRIRLGNRPRREALELLTLNSRTPRLFGRWLALLQTEADRLAVELTGQAPDAAALDQSVAAARAAIARLTPGRYSAQAGIRLPGTDREIFVRLEATLADAHLKLDFSGSDPQTDAPLNSTPAHTLDCCLGALIDDLPEFPACGGLAAITVDSGHARITGAALPATTGLSPYLTARGIRRATCEVLAAAGVAGIEPDAWWRRTGAALYAAEVDPVRLQLHPSAAARILALERATQGNPA